MADFNIAHRLTQKAEGGYANNPNDKGGETYRGIARKRHPDWKGWRIVDMLRISEKNNFENALARQPLLNELVDKFYKAEFWDTLNLDTLQSQKIANELYDTGVNMGTGVAGEFLQRALNVYNLNGKKFSDLKVDGDLGPKTIATFNGLDERGKGVIYKLLNVLQGAKYIAICESDPGQEIFVNSWFSRVFEAAA